MSTRQHKRANLYGSSLSAQRIASYQVMSPTAIKLSADIPTGGVCKGKTASYVQPMDAEPYYVFAASWPSPNACGVSLSVYPNGTLKGLADSWSYDRSSGIHGLAMGMEQGQSDKRQLLYSADLNGDSIWTHAVDKTTGTVKKLGSLKMAKSGIHPRHLAAHPNGTYLYVVMEAENTLHQIRLDESSVAVKDNQTYSLIPAGMCCPLCRHWCSDTELFLLVLQVNNPPITGLQTSCFLHQGVTCGPHREVNAALDTTGTSHAFYYLLPMAVLSRKCL